MPSKQIKETVSTLPGEMWYPLSAGPSHAMSPTHRSWALAMVKFSMRGPLACSIPLLWPVVEMLLLSLFIDGEAEAQGGEVI